MSAAYDHLQTFVQPSLTSAIDIDDSWGVECAWCPPVPVGEGDPAIGVDLAGTQS